MRSGHKSDISIYEKLSKIQSEISVKKSNHNSFGGYYYRNTEDILSELKTFLNKYSLVINLTDEIVEINQRFYIKSKATIICTSTGNKVSSDAFAREDEVKKGMDSSQITGSTSSYARKYALNGLLGLCDVKDSDFTNKGEKKIIDTNKNDSVQVKKPSYTFKHGKFENQKICEVTDIDGLKELASQSWVNSRPYIKKEILDRIEELSKITR